MTQGTPSLLKKHRHVALGGCHFSQTVGIPLEITVKLGDKEQLDNT